VRKPHRKIRGPCPLLRFRRGNAEVCRLSACPQKLPAASSPSTHHCYAHHHSRGCGCGQAIWQELRLEGSKDPFRVGLWVSALRNAQKV
jgi:hypothetical protein